MPGRRRIGRNKGASAISDRTGVRYPMSEMVIEPGTGYLVHRSETDGKWSLVEHPLNNTHRYLKGKTGDPFPVKNARPDRDWTTLIKHEGKARAGGIFYVHVLPTKTSQGTLSPLSGTASLEVSPNPEVVILAEVNSLDISASLTADATTSIRGLASLEISSQLTSDAIRERVGEASLTASSDLTATAIREFQGSASLNVTSNLSALGLATGQVLFLVEGSLSSAAEKEIPGQVSFTGVCTLEASLTNEGAASLVASSTLTASSTAEKPGSATLAGTASLINTATVNKPGSTTLTGSATLTSIATAERPGSTTLTGSATLTSDATVSGGAVVFEDFNSLFSITPTGWLNSSGSLGGLNLFRETAVPHEGASAQEFSNGNPPFPGNDRDHFIYKDFDLTGISELKLQIAYDGFGTGAASFSLRAGATGRGVGGVVTSLTTASSVTSSSGGYTEITLDVSSLSGTQTVEIYCVAPGDSTGFCDYLIGV